MLVTPLRPDVRCDAPQAEWGREPSLYRDLTEADLGPGVKAATARAAPFWRV